MKKTVIISILGVFALSSCKKDEPTPEPTPVDNTTTNYNLLNGGQSDYWFQDSMRVNHPQFGWITYSSLSYPWTQYTTEEVWIFSITPMGTPENWLSINYGDTTPDPSYKYNLSDLGSVINTTPVGSSPVMSSYKIVSLTDTKLTMRTFDSDTIRYFHKQ